MDSMKALSAFKNPTFDYKKYKIVAVGEKKVDVDLIFEATNPNNISIDSLFANYELFIKDKSFIKGKDLQLKLAANGKSEIRVPVEVYYKKILKSSGSAVTAIVNKEKTLPVAANIKIFGELEFTNYLATTVSYSKKIDMSVPIPHDASKQLEDKLKDKLKKLF